MFAPEQGIEIIGAVAGGGAVTVPCIPTEPFSEAVCATTLKELPKKADASTIMTVTINRRFFTPVITSQSML